PAVQARPGHQDDDLRRVRRGRPEPDRRRDRHADRAQRQDRRWQGRDRALGLLRRRRRPEDPRRYEAPLRVRSRAVERLAGSERSPGIASVTALATGRSIASVRRPHESLYEPCSRRSAGAAKAWIRFEFSVARRWQWRSAMQLRSTLSLTLMALLPF